MQMPYGTLSMADLLATTSQTVIDFGEERIWEVFSDFLAAHQVLYGQLRDAYCETTEELLFGIGGISDMEMQEVDEFGAPQPQKVTAGEPMGLPLRLYSGEIQWTRQFFLASTVQEVAAQFQGILTADLRKLAFEIKRALFIPTNYSFVDRLTREKPTLAVKRLANADSAAIPTGPNGEVFDASTHTHYLGSATLTAAALTSLIATVREHGSAGSIVVEINQAQEATVRGLSGFDRYIDSRIVMNNAASYAGNRSLDFSNIYNRPIGLFDGAEVWVKPWVPANYQLARATAGRKVLGFRVPKIGPKGLILASEDESYPLRARRWERKFGVGVINRVGAAVLYSANSTYAAPSLAA
jgi:hypothetical protein